MLIKIAILLIAFEQSLPQVAGQCCCPGAQSSSLFPFPFLPDYSWLLPHPTFGEDKKECGVVVVDAVNVVVDEKNAVKNETIEVFELLQC